MIIDYARRFWYRTKTVGKDGTTQIEVKWMPEAKDAYALWKSEGLIGPFDTEIEAISDYLNNVYGVSLALSENSDGAPDLRQRLEDTEALLIIARATQTTLQDELAAKDAEIMELRRQVTQWGIERRKIWDLVMQADSSWSLTNDLYELLK